MTIYLVACFNGAELIERKGTLKKSTVKNPG